MENLVRKRDILYSILFSIIFLIGLTMLFQNISSFDYILNSYEETELSIYGFRPLTSETLHMNAIAIIINIALSIIPIFGLKSIKNENNLIPMRYLGVSLLLVTVNVIHSVCYYGIYSSYVSELEPFSNIFLYISLGLSGLMLIIILINTFLANNKTKKLFKPLMIVYLVISFLLIAIIFSGLIYLIIKMPDALIYTYYSYRVHESVTAFQYNISIIIFGLLIINAVIAILTKEIKSYLINEDLNNEKLFINREKAQKYSRIAVFSVLIFFSLSCLIDLAIHLHSMNANNDIFLQGAEIIKYHQPYLKSLIYIHVFMSLPVLILSILGLVFSIKNKKYSPYYLLTSALLIITFTETAFSIMYVNILTTTGFTLDFIVRMAFQEASVIAMIVALSTRRLKKPNRIHYSYMLFPVFMLTIVASTSFCKGTLFILAFEAALYLPSFNEQAQAMEEAHQINVKNKKSSKNILFANSKILYIPGTWTLCEDPTNVKLNNEILTLDNPKNYESRITKIREKYLK